MLEPGGPLRSLGARERWLTLLLLAEVADIATTSFGLAHGSSEANPGAAAILAAGGMPALAIAKLALVPAAGGALALAHRLRTRRQTEFTFRFYGWSWRGMKWGVGLLTFVSLSNLTMVAITALAAGRP